MSPGWQCEPGEQLGVDESGDLAYQAAVESQDLDGERLVFGPIAVVDGQRRLGVGPGGGQPKPARAAGE
jgi:hypothetical protein